MEAKRHTLSFEDWTAVSRRANFIEFDWIGIDVRGQFGIFSSISMGYTPPKVFSSYERYVKLDNFLSSLTRITSANLVTGESGNLEYWINWAQKGFFAYDNQDIHREIKYDRYDLIASPDIAMLANSIRQLNEFEGIIPRFQLTFSNDILFSRLDEGF